MVESAGDRFGEGEGQVDESEEEGDLGQRPLAQAAEAIEEGQDTENRSLIAYFAVIRLIRSAV